jgi:hypothetical protein
MKIRTTHKRHIIILGLLLFVVTQYSAMVHASAHFFHSPDTLCDVYNAIEHNKTGFVTPAIHIPFIPFQAEQPVRHNLIVSTAYFIFLPSRAPPRT